MERFFEIRAVLGGAYRGKALEERALLLHYFETTGEGAKRSFCGRIKAANLCDGGSREEYEAKEATCPVCKEKFEKLTEKARAGKVSVSLLGVGSWG